MEVHGFDGDDLGFPKYLVAAVQDYEDRDIDIADDETLGIPGSFEEYGPPVEKDDYNAPYVKMRK
jgi:hypothetical protein